MNILQKYNKKQVDKALSNKDLPYFKSGYTLRVHFQILDGAAVRTQVFEGVCIAVKSGNNLGASVLLYKISHGIGVLKRFPIYSSLVTKIEVVKKGQVSRARIYYYTKLKGKASRLKEEVRKSLGAKSS